MPEEKVTSPRSKTSRPKSGRNFHKRRSTRSPVGGFNIMDGIKDVMKDNADIKVNIVETSDESDFKVGLLAHSRVGKNVDPKSKITEFVILSIAASAKRQTRRP